MNNNQDASKNDKFSKGVAKLPLRYRPPARNSLTSGYKGMAAGGVVANATAKLENMSICGGAGRSPARQSFPAPMKVVGWHNQSDGPLLAKAHHHSAKPISRKVA